MKKLIDMDTVREEFDRLQRYTATAPGILETTECDGGVVLASDIKKVIDKLEERAFSVGIQDITTMPIVESNDYYRGKYDGAKEFWEIWNR